MRKPINWREAGIRYLLKRDNNICLLCDKPIRRNEGFDVDHIQEIKNNGDSNFDNRRIVHVGCHRRRYMRGHTKLPSARRIFSNTTYIDRISLTKDEIRQNILDQLNQGKTITSVAKGIGVSRLTVYRLLKRKPIEKPVLPPETQ